MDTTFYRSENYVFIRFRWKITVVYCFCVFLVLWNVFVHGTKLVLICLGCSVGLVVRSSFFWTSSKNKITMNISRKNANDKCIKPKSMWYKCLEKPLQRWINVENSIRRERKRKKKAVKLRKRKKSINLYFDFFFVHFLDKWFTATLSTS